ncbi:AroM family protein [Paenibacillus doosanensis]|uniref:AroM family protein n=1 Tax=Paenibacillus doosanensis TaxID=1229154 RepID=UPI00217F334E|nr:AroM family protein [Paenibacillus doosanensis]MCS7462228.1 AroM family protein [Paenibacillus doosanensis]
MEKLGMITIGQAPRTDVAPIIEKYLEGRAELVQVGVLDGMTKAYIEENLFPEEGDYVLTSRLTTGDSVVMSRKKIQPILQNKINELEQSGIRQILLLCTGVFPGLTTATSYLIEPDHIIPPTVKAMVGSRRLGVIVPLIEQKENLKPKYSPLGLDPLFSVASPYINNLDNFRQAATELKDTVDIIVLDCMGYTEEARELVAKTSGLPVVLSNAIMAKLVSEMI